MHAPTEDRVGALVKTSASGPMPTSRYWLQAPGRRAPPSGPSLRRAGLSRLSRRPPGAATSARMAAAAPASPRARSSITRSSIDTAKVTPAALTPEGRWAPEARASTSRGCRMACSRRSPPANRSSRPAPSSRRAPDRPVAASPLTVEQAAEMSNSPSSLTATTDGPMPGRQTRPAKAPANWSAGRMRESFSVEMIPLITSSGWFARMPSLSARTPPRRFFLAIHDVSRRLNCPRRNNSFDGRRHVGARGCQRAGRHCGRQPGPTRRGHFHLRYPKG